LNHYFNRSLPVLFCLALAAFTQTGCRENTLINSKVSPASNSVGVYEATLDCKTGTYYDDTIVTSANTIVGIGAMSDPYFGSMTSSAFFQIVPTNAAAGLFDGVPEFDSAYLVLPYSGFSYGDTSNQSLTLDYQVFYVPDTMSVKTLYYSYSTKPIATATPLSDPTTVNLYHVRDSVSLAGKNYRPGMRIKLNKNVLYNYITAAFSGMGSSAAPVDYFKGAFGGICVKPVGLSTTYAMPYFQLNNSGTYGQATIAVYYHRPPKDSMIVENFTFNASNCANFNSVQKSYTGTPSQAVSLLQPPNDSVVALQNLPGMNIDVSIAGITRLPLGIINKADLLITILPGNNGTYAPPFSLYPIGIGNGTYPTGVAAGSGYNVADRYPLTSVSAFAILDGSSHLFNVNGTTVNTYTIGIPREVMASMAAKNDVLHFHIMGSTDYFGAYHLVAGGGNNSNPAYRAKLKVVYSQLNK
jgi:hypothetical protein